MDRTLPVGIEVPRLERPHLPRGTSTRVTRAATLGLASVLVALAAYTILAAYATQGQVDRAASVEALQEAFVRATFDMQAAETAELEYHLEPSQVHLVNMDAANKAVMDAVHEAAALGGPADRQLANDLQALQDRHLSAVARFTSAILAGNATEARRIDLEESDPLLQAMRVRLAAAADDAEVINLDAFGALRTTTQWTLVLAPIIFAIGLGLMLALWRVLEGYHRATRENYREIEQLSKLRSEFVSIVSHEFRTPLTGIQGFSEMLRDEDLPIAEMREYANDINMDARRLARLITDMLDLDRMESGRMTLDSVRVDLNDIVAETAAHFRLSEADHPIELDLDPGVREVIGDRDRLTQVVTNLLSNAIKYSPAGGVVELRTKRLDGTVTLTVRDHGMGIPAEHLEKIFDRYSRIETAETRTIQGTGLGLPIVRQIVQMCHGRVWATSESGQGSVFHVQLPLPQAATRPNAA